MTASIIRRTGAEAYDLIFPEHLSMLSVLGQETIHRAMMNSYRVWLAVDEDKVIAVWGLIPPTLLSDRAYLWLHTTKHFSDYAFVFLRHSRNVVQQMLDHFPIIVGHGSADSPRSLRWLHWLGAEFDPPQGPFLPFTIRADKWQQVSAQSA